MKRSSLLTRPIGAALLCVVLLLGLVGCGERAASAPTATATAPAPSVVPTETVPQPTPTATATVAPSAMPQPATEPSADFEEAPCPFTVPPGVAVDCGYVVVPEDHARTDGPTIKLSVAVFRDTSDERQPDPLVLLSGGPGEKTVERALNIAQFLARFAPNRDLVIYDQRGVGLSEPALDCPEVLEVAFGLLDESDPEVAMVAGFEAVVACHDRLVADGHDLAVYTTAQSAADVDAIRRVLGYDKVNLYGASYGSFLAQATMRDYPEGIRSVILESVWPLEVSFFAESSERIARTALQLLEDCEADEGCANAYPDVKSVLFDVIDGLNAEPVPITVTNPLDGQSYPAVLSGDGVYGILVSTLYQTQLIPALPQAIYDVSNGDYGLMTQLSGARLMLFDLVTRGVQYSVICVEDLVGRTREEVLARVAALPTQLQGRVDPEQAIDYGIFGICEKWTSGEADPSFKEPLVSDIPTLLMAGEYDGITPPEYARQVADRLSNSTMFEVPAAGHDGETLSDCAVGIIVGFIDDPEATLEASCIEQIPAMAFDLPTEPVEIVLEPYESEALGIRGVVPAGWTEPSPGIFARASSALDPVAMQLVLVAKSAEDLLAIVATQFGLDQSPARVDQREANGLAWNLYEFDAQGVHRFLALAEADGQTLIVVMRYDADERDALHEDVFIPVVDALVPYS